MTQAGQTKVLTNAGKLATSNVINQGKASNHLQFICKGDEYTLWVNGQNSVSVKDSTFTQGSVGLIASTFDTGGAEIHFMKYVVTTP